MIIPFVVIKGYLSADRYYSSDQTCLKRSFLQQPLYPVLCSFLPDLILVSRLVTNLLLIVIVKITTPNHPTASPAIRQTKRLYQGLTQQDAPPGAFRIK